jgi:hypothetical protein
MRTSEPLRLARLDPERAASLVAHRVLYRARRDASRVGLAVFHPSPDGQTEEACQERATLSSKAYRNALLCAVWAATGKGKPEEIAAALRELRGDLEGVAPADARGLAPDLTTTVGVLVVAVAARLALREGLTVDAVDVATLASVDARTVRAAVQAGALQPLPSMRPMRFAADVACAYLYARGVPGFGAPRATDAARVTNAAASPAAGPARAA